MPRRPFPGRLLPCCDCNGPGCPGGHRWPLFPRHLYRQYLGAVFPVRCDGLTVDILWGYAGILTFGQAAFFGIGAYAAGIIFTYMDFSPTDGDPRTSDGSGHLCGGGRPNRLDLVFPRRLATVCRDRDTGAADHPCADPLHRRDLHRLIKRARWLQHLRPICGSLVHHLRHRPCAADLGGLVFRQQRFRPSAGRDPRK